MKKVQNLPAQWENLNPEWKKPSYSVGKSSLLSGKILAAQWENLPAQWRKNMEWKNMLEWRQELRERVKISPPPSPPA
jgi:hypothetical protein